MKGVMSYGILQGKQQVDLVRKNSLSAAVDSAEVSSRVFVLTIACGEYWYSCLELANKETGTKNTDK